MFGEAEAIKIHNSSGRVRRDSGGRSRAMSTSSLSDDPRKVLEDLEDYDLRKQSLTKTEFAELRKKVLELNIDASTSPKFLRSNFIFRFRNSSVDSQSRKECAYIGEFIGEGRRTDWSDV